MIAPAEEIPSAILTGKSPFMSETQFQDVMARALAGELVRYEDAVNFSPRHWKRLGGHYTKVL
jgi:hypothetical protein